MLVLGSLMCAPAVSATVVSGIRLSDISGQPLPAFKGLDDKGRFGIFFGTREKNSVFLIGVDYDRYKMQRGDSLLYSRRLTVSIGYRYDLFPAAKEVAMKFTPFIGLCYFKSFSKVSADSATMSPADVTYFKDLSNDSGGWLSIGGEYSFAPSFALGAEGGVRYSTAKSKAYGYQVKLSEYHTYIALLLTFYWQ